MFSVSAGSSSSTDAIASRRSFAAVLMSTAGSMERTPLRRSFSTIQSGVDTDRSTLRVTSTSTMPVAITATAAAWMTLEDPSGARGTTIGFNVSYLRGLRGKDAIASARVVRAGRQIIVLSVEIADPDGEPCATALVTYKLDRPG